jgi:putative salt-induced outer membrane protein YdiY
MRSNVLVLVLLVMVSACPIRADEVLLKNGDRLTGKIETFADGKLIFKSDVADAVTIPVAKIQTFSSDSPIQVHLKDGTVFNVRVFSAQADHFAIQTTETLQAQEFRLADIVSINPPAKPKPKWSGDISAGFTSTHGNTRTETASASANIMRRTEKDRTQLSADYARGRQEDPDTGEKKTTEDWWRTRAKYDYFFTKKMYGYMDGRYEKDAIAELDRRVIVGGGAGYQWIESDDMNFSTEIGLASLYEKFDNQDDSNSELSAQAGYHFDKRIIKAVKFIHDLTYYPSIEKFSDYYLTSTAELRANFTARMFTNFKVIFGYDATPAPGQGSTDVKYIWGLGLSF